MFNLAMMAARSRGLQVLRPFSDVDATGWSPTPLWDQINELVADTSDFVACANASGIQDFTVAISSGNAAPAFRDRHTIWIQLCYAGIDAPDAGSNTTVDLLQGVTLIATLVIPNGSLSTSFSIFNYPLTPTEAASISDYSNLRLKVRYDPGPIALVDNECRVSWLNFECPQP
jgi:hypothetical protein